MADTDEQSNTKLPSTDIASAPTLLDNPDPFLAWLVATANLDVEMSITLNVGGLLITGTLVSYKKYFEGIRQEFINASGSGGAGFADLISSFLPEAEPGENSTYSLEPVQHIHLRDARIIAADGRYLPGNRGVWWRSPLSAVSGFMLGTIGPS